MNKTFKTILQILSYLLTAILSGWGAQAML